MVIIRLGNEVYKDSEGYRLLRFLNLLMYPHKDDFMESISDYIDFSGNEELWKEREHMFSLGRCILEEGREKGRKEGIQEGRKEGIQEGRKEGIQEGRKEGIQEGRREGIQALIMSNSELKIPKKQTLLALQRYFEVPEEQAERYYQEFAQEERQSKG